MPSPQTILGITSLCLILIAVVIFIAICITIFKSREEFQDITLLLMCNTCLTLFLTCVAVCIMTISNLTTGFLTNNFGICVTFGLLYDMFECSIYYSYCLQAIFRLFRVVFYKKKSLTTYTKFIYFTIGQWLLVIILLLPPIPLKWYTKLPTEKYCLISYTDVSAEVYHIIIIYVIPLICISVIYAWIITFVRYISRKSSVMIASKQRQRNLRDLTIVKHIVISIAILVSLRFPTVIFMVNGIVVGHLYSLTYGIVGLIASVCLIIIGLMTIYMTPPLRRNTLIIFMCRNCEGHPENTRQKGSQIPIAVVGDIFTNRQERLTNTSEEAGVGHKF
jgi:hypothetical protein